MPEVKGKDSENHEEHINIHFVDFKQFFRLLANVTSFS